MEEKANQRGETVAKLRREQHGIQHQTEAFFQDSSEVGGRLIQKDIQREQAELEWYRAKAKAQTAANQRKRYRSKVKPTKSKRLNSRQREQRVIVISLNLDVLRKKGVIRADSLGYFYQKVRESARKRSNFTDFKFDVEKMWDHLLEKMKENDMKPFTEDDLKLIYRETKKGRGCWQHH